MCRKHLLGEHVEMHMFAASLRDGKSITGFQRDGLVDVANIKQRHDELAAELRERGFDHASPMLQEPVSQYFHPHPIIATVNIVTNILELARRCPDCREGLWARYGVLKPDLTHGGDAIKLSIESGLWHYQLNGVLDPEGHVKRDVCITKLEKARRAMKEAA